MAEYSRRDASLLSKPRTAILFEPDSSGRPPKESLKILTEGHQYYRQIFKKPKPGDWLTVLPAGFTTITDRSDVLMGKVVAIHAVKSNSNPFPEIPLKQLTKRRLKLRADPTEVTTLREYFQLRQACWLVEETDQGEFNCDCPLGFKGKNCKHGLGLAYKKEKIPVLPHAEALKLGERRKRGRPKRINMQKPFSASAVVAAEPDDDVPEDLVDDVSEEVAVELSEEVSEVVAVEEELILEVAGLEELAKDAPTLEELAQDLDGFVWEVDVEKEAEKEEIPEPVRPKRGRPKKFIQVEDPVQEEGTFGRKVQRKKVVSPALKSGVRKAKPTRSKKTSSPSSKRKRVSAPPSANTSPVLKPPRKSNRRNLGLVEQLIV